MSEDPRRIRMSKHFVLSDFLGNHSVYSQGLPNLLDRSDPGIEVKIGNAVTLCECALEPLLQEYGAMSISYGYISPEVSARIVKYQDPDKPSHHRWDLGAAVDVCMHNWVAGNFKTAGELYFPEDARSSPVALAHWINYADIPYSRLITYSESPYLCIAVSEREARMQAPRKAFYENRYTGVPKGKPDYRQYSTPKAKNDALDALQTHGLPVDWRGKGYPTYHGGGRQQYQHMRVSAYTMVSDWLFDLKSISEGHKNIPSLNLESVQDSFAAAGIVYDWILDHLGIPRASIIEGYVSHLNPSFDKNNDWRSEFNRFKVMLPDGMDERETTDKLFDHPMADAVEFGWDNGALVVHLDVESVLRAETDVA